MAHQESFTYEKPTLVELSSGSKGVGLFTTHAISRGSLLFAEYPLLIVTKEEEEDELWDWYLMDKFTKLSHEDKTKYLALSSTLDLPRLRPHVIAIRLLERRAYKFDCDCPTCEPSPQRDISDGRRQRLWNIFLGLMATFHCLEDEAPDYTIIPEDSTKALDMAKETITLLLDEGIAGDDLTREYEQLAVYHIINDNKQEATRAIFAAEENAISCGKDDDREGLREALERDCL
ncbi:hypothetical protein F5Y19DRAFT_490036 [Xylariaceae sp. FL1651]|nr:hypothetical protein F5Y19DRAFT_490036 [Xylariaceae sp. FL1651]